MRTRRPQPSSAVPFLCIALAALLAAWAGCSASGSTHANANSVGSANGGSTSATGVGGGLGGSGGTGAVDGGKDGSGAADAGDGAPMCTPVQKLCNGVCVDVDDPQYGCGPNSCTACAPYTNGTAACSAGGCALGSCAMGFKNCNGNDADGCETDTQTDPMQCGACGSPCILVHATATCTGGICTVGSCDTGGWTDCSGADGGVTGGGDGGTMGTIGCGTNTQGDPMNCGGCGKTCPGQESCQAGMCGLTCAKGFANCPGDPADECPTPLGTNKNCNFCGDTCNLSNSTSQCMPMGGTNVCNLTSCNAGWANCDMIAADGCETNTQTDASNCDACGNACPFGPHSTAVCNAGGCGLVCDPGFANCDGNAANGCEVDTQTNPADCGGCGMACSSNNATETCTAGMCSIVSCTSGFADCDKNPANGCEANTQSDAANCGVCGDICKTNNGTPSCVQGSCSVASCNSGYAHCPGQPGTNCETITSNDPKNCGSCGTACSTNNDTPLCTAGSCSVVCSAGFGNCDGNAANGCETSLSTTSNCGSCSNGCTTLNGTATCNTATSPATCAVGGCTAGYASCPGNGTNCLTFIGGSDVTNCGGCGITCGSDATNPNLHDSGACVGGGCTVGTCDANWANCDGQLANGCETPINTIANCGGCGIACSTVNGMPACNLVGGAWTCQVASCNTGFANCPGNGTNCSTNLKTDDGNCGVCGNNCNVTCGGSADHVSTTTCNAGVCGVSVCATGYNDFDGQCADGCECLSSSTQAACNNASSLFAGTLQPGNSITPFTSTMAPASVTQAYFTLTFGGNGGTSFHPKISITSASGEFVMDVNGTCTGGLLTTCADNGTKDSDGVTTWETSYSGPSPAGDPNSKSPGGGSNFDAIPLPGNSGQVWIRVYRKAGATATCDTYTITASD